MKPGTGHARPGEAGIDPRHNPVNRILHKLVGVLRPHVRVHRPRERALRHVRAVQTARTHPARGVVSRIGKRVTIRHQIAHVGVNAKTASVIQRACVGQALIDVGLRRAVGVVPLRRRATRAHQSLFSRMTWVFSIPMSFSFRSHPGRATASIRLAPISRAHPSRTGQRCSQSPAPRPAQCVICTVCSLSAITAVRTAARTSPSNATHN